MALAVGWAALFFDAWRIGQPLTLRMGHRRAAVGINGILCFSVAAVLLFGAHLVGVQRDFIQTMFGSGDASGAHDGRYNVLLLGGDSGVDRWGLRPDSITVASIDAETGRTVLVSLPRNMQNFPFAKGSVMHEQFPQGFDCEHCMLNGVNTWAMDNKELFGKAKNPGIDATISAVEGITGLKINYWAMVNLKGFRDLVDAVGGVTLNVRQRIPIGGLGSDVYDYIEPGQAEAHRLPDPVVRASPRRLRRLLPDGAAEVRDGRDARPARPDRRAQELPEDRQGELGHGADEHPGQRGRPLHRAGAQGARPEGLDALDRAAALRHLRAGRQADPAEGRRGDRRRRGHRTQKAADADGDAQAKPGKNKKPEAARRRDRWLGRLAERGVRRQRVPGPRQRLLNSHRGGPPVGRRADSRVDAMSTPTVLAVDGNSLLHRAFHASARTMYRTPDGAQGWAVRGLLSQLVSAVDRVCADAVVVGFDDRGNSSRKKRWPSYKAQRAPKPESLERQLDLAVQVLRDLGVVVVVPEGLEADDVLASVAAQAPTLGAQTVVATSDRDSFSLIDEHTRMLRILNGGVDASPLLDPERLAMVTGVRPDQYLDLAALRGDTSDNLPGVHGFGTKTAVRLLQALGTAQAAFDDAASGGEQCSAAIGKARAKALVAPEAEERWLFNREVMAMVTTADVGLEPRRARAGCRSTRTPCARRTPASSCTSRPRSAALTLREPTRTVAEPYVDPRWTAAPRPKLGPLPKLVPAPAGPAYVQEALF